MDRFADRELAAEFNSDMNHLMFLGPLLAGTMDVTRLAEKNGLTKAAVSKRMARLRAEGWVTLSSDPKNARRVLVTLTDRGRDFATRSGQLLETRFSTMAEELGIDPAVLKQQVEALIAGVIERTRPTSD